MQYAYADADTTSQEKVISGAFASTLHLLFIALLVFGVNWQKKVEPQVNIVDLWSPPSHAEPKPVAPSPPPPEPPRPVVQPKVEPPPPKPVAKPELVKPDIAFKDRKKVEKERPVVEEKLKEVTKREAEAKAVQKEQAEAQRLAAEQAEAQRAVAAQAAAAQSKMRSEYMERIRAKILKGLIKPQSVTGSEEAEFNIVLLPDGNVLNAKVKRASGNAAYDTAIERAITRAQPLPMPPDPALLKEFRELNLKFNAKE
ncbi:MAG: cell envelope integrity protein TolA [Burkholderiales bacterium]